MISDDFGDVDPIIPSVFLILPFIFFTAVLLFLSLLYRQSDVTVFCLLLIVLCLGVRYWSRFGTRGVECRSSVSRERVFPGENLMFRTRVRNRNFLPVFVKIRSRIRYFLHEGQTHASFAEECGLLWKQAVVFEHLLTAQRRGVYRIGSPDLTIGDFFGLYPRRKFVQQSVEVVVFPRIVSIKSLPLLRKILFGKPGRTSPVLDPIYVLGTREYQSFSPSRHIHWKASARLAKLQEKIFEPAEQNKVLLVLDGDRFFAHEARDAFEQTIEVIASFAAILDSEKFALGFVTNCRRKYGGGKDLPGVRYAIQLPALFNLLAEIEMLPTREMGALLEESQKPPADMTCVYFSYDRGSVGIRSVGRSIPAVQIYCCPDPTDGESPYEEAGNKLSDFLM